MLSSSVLGFLLFLPYGKLTVFLCLFLFTALGFTFQLTLLMLYLPGGGAMLFLTDVDHVSFEKANETRQNNLQLATVSLQVVIGLCKRKETAALKIKAAVS